MYLLVVGSMLMRREVYESIPQRRSFFECRSRLGHAD
jgi:hypothetical protein